MRKKPKNQKKAIIKNACVIVDLQIITKNGFNDGDGVIDIEKNVK